MRRSAGQASAPKKITAEPVKQIAQKPIQENQRTDIKSEPAQAEEQNENKSGYLTGFTGMFKRIIKETATLVTATEETKTHQPEPVTKSYQPEPVVETVAEQPIVE